jgi:putative holliday junction resolvase
VRALGVDLGTRRIGVALSDATGTLATPFALVERGPDAPRRIAEIVAAEEVAVVVVGLPRSMDGRDRAAAERARTDAAAIERLVDVPVELHDERLSTVSAHASLAAAGRSSRQRRGMVDAAAAAVILQSWLDAPAGRRFREGPTEVTEIQ